MPALRIFVAEDDPILREVYRRKLSSLGYDVTAFPSGADILRYVQKQAPDAMLCDLKMPDTDGFAVLKSLPRKDRSFPIVILTNFEERETHDRCAALGADDLFIKKDMTLSDLAAMVEHLLRTR